mmetsp:Transcript_66796/g.155171  ORF Transcript_66796/g.155171 Transcript_66796/m.155171 type:complete len:229 (-) Transcript_66796:1431-2117(-)
MLRSSSLALMTFRTSRMVALSMTLTTRHCEESEVAWTTRRSISFPSLISRPISETPCSTSSSTELNIKSLSRTFSPAVDSTIFEAGPRPTFCTIASFSCFTSTSLEIVSFKVFWSSLLAIVSSKSRVGLVVLQSSVSSMAARNSVSFSLLKTSVLPFSQMPSLSCHLPGGLSMTFSLQSLISSWNSLRISLVSTASGTPLAPSQFSPGSGATFLCHQDSKRFWMMLDL